MHTTPVRSMDRRMFLRASAGAVGGLSVMGLMACGGDDEASGSENGAAGMYSGGLSVPLFEQVPDNAPFIIAMENGYFDEARLELKPVNFTQGPDVIRSVTSSTHLGNSSAISGIVAFANGLPDLRIVGTCMGRPAVVFLVAGDSPIEDVAQLKGKKVGVNAPTSITTYLGEKMVRDAGLEPGEDVELINVEGVPDSATALENGIVDCAWSSPPLSIQLIDEGAARLLYDAGEANPDFIQSCLFSTSEFLETDGDVVRRWVDATARGQDFIRENTEEAGRIWAKFIGVDVATATGTLKAMGPGFRIQVKEEGYERNNEACQTLELIERPVPYGDIVFADYADQASGT